LDVVIIGAGLSGLAAAAVLREAGADVVLVEAGRQIGGRIRVHHEPGTNRALADLGPTWVWPRYQPVVSKWIVTLGLETFDQFIEGDAVIQGYAPTTLRQSLPSQDGIARVVGGPSAFIDALAKRLDTAKVRTSTPVTGIFESGSHGISVHLGSGEAITASQVIISVPLRVAAASLDMPWASSELVDAMRRTPTWMSSHAKAVALYERPFWRMSGLSGRIASRIGPLVEAHDHSGRDGVPAAIFGFVGWPPQVRRRDPDGLKRAILEQLSECLGPAAAHPINLVVQDWATHPYIVTDVDISEPANHPDIAPFSLRQAHLDGRVRFAVSEASEVSPGLIEGALAAGERAGNKLIQIARNV